MCDYVLSALFSYYGDSYITEDLTVIKCTTVYITLHTAELVNNEKDLNVIQRITSKHLNAASLSPSLI